MSDQPTPPAEGASGAAPPSRVLRAVVSYDGTDFFGWQRQPGLRTVQGVIEDGIRELLGEEVFVRAAGRTDAGVHADGQVASFALASRIPPHGLLRGLNSILPADVALVEVAEAAADFDARFSARGKVYRYTVFNHMVRSPRHARVAWHVRRALDMTAIRQAAALLVGEHDFRAFRASDCERRTTRRILRRLEVDRQGAILTFDVEATAFLKNMVRILVGTLVDVGRGHLGPEAVARMLETGDRAAGGMTAPPQGLTLLRVHY
ncbi:MAG TPA: tRNA pseudouridine(38-40) synthase TruA [Polyangia bacterium]|nr:tRNA pseudouridine(38-40) synthase TruA [Polyangia bacterium]